MKRHLILFIFMLLISNSFAQTETDETAWELLPLQTLIDSAFVYSPFIKSADVSIQLSEFQLTDVRRNWLQKISIYADTRAGSMFDYSRLANLSGSGFIPPSANLYMLNYGAGFGAYIPFSDIFDRKRQLQKAQLQIEQSHNQKSLVEQQVKKSVVDAYYDVLMNQKTLVMRREISSSAGILFDQSKIDYAENRIGLAEYTKAYDLYLSAQNDVEIQKFNLLKAVCTLEIIVGIQLIK